MLLFLSIIERLNYDGRTTMQQIVCIFLQIEFMERNTQVLSHLELEQMINSLAAVLNRLKSQVNQMKQTKRPLFMYGNSDAVESI